MSYHQYPLKIQNSAESNIKKLPRFFNPMDHDNDTQKRSPGPLGKLNSSVPRAMGHHAPFVRRGNQPSPVLYNG